MSQEHEHCRDLLRIHMENERYLERARKHLRSALRSIADAQQARPKRLRELADEALEADTASARTHKAGGAPWVTPIPEKI